MKRYTISTLQQCYQNDEIKEEVYTACGTHGETNAHSVLVGKPERRDMRRREDNTKMKLSKWWA
jgi:hypothetical protein